MFTSLFTLSSQIHSHTLSPISQWGWFLFSLLLSLSCFSNFSHPLLLSPFLPPFLSTLFIFHHHPLPLLPYSFLPPPPAPTTELIYSWLNDWILGCHGNLEFCSRKGDEYTRRKQNVAQINIEIKVYSAGQLRCPGVTQPLQLRTVMYRHNILESVYTVNMQWTNNRNYGMKTRVTYVLRV